MKFAFVTPRYGADIAHGPEHACRLLAEQVSQRHDVDVLTTCARHDRPWRNDYPEGLDRIRGVQVRRFSVAHPTEPGVIQQAAATLLATPHSRADELEWTRRLGPWSPGLIDHLKRHHRSYDALVFFSLCHATTTFGLQAAPERSILFPYLELRPELRFGIWRDILSSAKAIGWFSGSERQLSRTFIRHSSEADELVGIGIDPPPQQAYPRHQQDPADTLAPDEDGESDGDMAEDYSHLSARGAPFRRRHRLYDSFVLYGGRVEPDNGCEEMLEYFDSYAATNGSTALVLMGVKMMKVPDERYLRLAGVLPDRERMVAFEAAEVTLAPASDDVLAQSLLESFAVGTPVLACARNRAAVEHCQRANAGLYYADRREFVAALRLLMSDARLRERLGDNGRQYVRQQYRWEAVLGRFDRLVSKTKGR